MGLASRAVEPFSLVGVVWEDPRAVLEGRVQVRTRSVDTGAWSRWQDLETDAADGADPGAAETRAHGSTAPLWVGASDGVEARVRPSDTTTAPLPAGLRLDLVDPGAEPPRDSSRAAAARTVLPALTKAESESQAGTGAGTGTEAGAETGAAAGTEAEAGAEAEAGVEVRAEVLAAARRHAAPRPKIILRRGWGADERLRENGYAYTKTVKAAFVHHSASGNGYSCAQAGSLLRGIYRFHVKSSGWRDFGYNFAVDKCGNVYEGRAGGVAKPVMGAHTLGFNTNSTGIAVLGTYSRTNPSNAAVNAVAKLAAWKLGLHGANPKGTTWLTSAGSNLYKKGRNVRLNVVSGHRDGFSTECPGSRLYGKLGSIRWTAARLQGR